MSKSMVNLNIARLQKRLKELEVKVEMSNAYPEYQKKLCEKYSLLQSQLQETLESGQDMQPGII